MKVRYPFPGNYDVKCMRPLETNIEPYEGLMLVTIPKATVEPWQVHVPNFFERIEVVKGDLTVELWNREELYKLIFGEGEDIEVEWWIPHRLINFTTKDVQLAVYYSPTPWRKEMEPEFRTFEEALDFAAKRNI